MNFISKATCLSIFSLIGFGLPIPAWAGPFEDGLAAYNAKHYGQAAGYWRTAARNGDAESQFNLGYMYLNGQGVMQSNSQAVFWYLKAADQEHVAAVTALKRLNISRTDNQDINLRKNALLGDEVETVNLPSPKPLSKSPSKSSVKQNGSADGFVSIDKFLETMPVLETADELYQLGLRAFTDEDYKRAVGYWHSAAETGHAPSQDYLAHMYFTGKGTKKDYGQALNYYHKAAEQNNIPSQKQLAILYDAGKFGVKKSDKQAAHWYEKAANLGDVPAMYQTGLLYYEGKGVPKSENTAISWLQKAANGGYAPAMIRLKALGANN